MTVTGWDKSWDKHVGIGHKALVRYDHEGFGGDKFVSSWSLLCLHQGVTVCVLASPISGDDAWAHGAKLRAMQVSYEQKGMGAK